MAERGVWSIVVAVQVEPVVRGGFRRVVVPHTANLQPKESVFSCRVEVTVVALLKGVFLVNGVVEH